MSIITTAQHDQQDMKDSVYTTDYLKWKGRIADVPVVQEMLEAHADAVVNSYKLTGSNARKMERMLKLCRGSGKETFKLILKNMYKIARVCGDSYAECVYDDEGNIDLQILPSDNIQQVVKNGRIIKYKELNSSVEWMPNEIFHLPYRPNGATSHGTSTIEGMNNLLLDWLQLMDDSSKMFHRYVKPWYLFKIDTDDEVEIQKFMDKVKTMNKTSDGDMFVPKGTVDVERHGIPQFSTLDPSMFNRILMDQFFMSMRMSEQLMGAGSVNSEESARIQMAGFLQSVKSDQEWLAEHVESQLFSKIFTDRIPNIRFSYGVEPEEDRYSRMMQMFQTINNSAINDELKGTLLIKILADMKVIENV